MGNEATHVVQECEQKRFSVTPFDLDGWPIHHVTLPEIIGEFRLKASAVLWLLLG
jgi:hypothetical protein